MTLIDIDVTITWWPALCDVAGERIDHTWSTLGRWLATAAPRPTNVDDPALAGWSPATFRDDKRSKASVELVTALGLDIDTGAVSLEQLREVLAGRAAIVHLTRRATPSSPRWRVVVAVSRPMTSDEQPKVWAHARERLSAAGIALDEQPKDGSRFWYVPCEPAEGEYVLQEFVGEPLDVDAIVRAQLPVAPRATPPYVARSNGNSYGAGALASACKLVASAQNGTRNATLNDQAFAIAGLAAGGELDAEVARVELERAALAAGLSASETTKTIASAFRAGVERPRTKPERPVREEPSPASATAPTPAAVEPWSGRVVEPSSEWFTRPPPARAWLLRDGRTKQCDGALPLGKVALLIGEGGVSKTMALIALIIATATGTSWLGAYTVATQGRVLALLGEEDLEEVPRRLFNARRASKAPIPENGSIVVLPLAGVPSPMIETDERGNPYDASFLVWLRGYVAEHGPFALVVVDPLSRFGGRDVEVDNAAATRFVQALESVAGESGATVVVAHHTNKVARAGGAISGSAARGSSAIYDGVRWAAALSSERVEMGDADVAAHLDEVVTLAVVKSNYSKKGEPLQLRRDHENGGALLPLDDEDVKMIGAAREQSAPATKKRAQLDADREARAARRDAARAERDATAAQQDAELAAKADKMLLAILREQPGLNARELRVALRVRLEGCRNETADFSLARLGARVRREPGPRSSLRHYLAEEAQAWTA